MAYTGVIIMIIILFFWRGEEDVLTICIYVFVDELIKGSLQLVFFWIVNQHLILHVHEWEVKTSTFQETV